MALAASLLASRRFAPLFVTNLLDAFNDNLFKTALLMLVSYGLYRAEPARAQAFAAIAGGVFVAPFFLFSAMAGEVADRFDRARVVRWVKVAEVAIMALGLAGFAGESIPILLAALFLAGVHSAFYSPLKYAILPGHLHGAELMTATGMMEAGGFVAILGGQLLAGVVAPWAAGATACGLACVGLAASVLIAPSPPANPGSRPAAIGLNVAARSWRLVRRASRIGPVWFCILANAWFYVVGAVLLGELIPLAKGVLHVRREVTGVFLALFSVGVAGGALLVGRLLGGGVSARYVPISALGLGVFLLDFAAALGGRASGGLEVGAGAFLADPGGWRIVADLLGAAVCGGVFVVPLYAIVQTRSPDDERARILAANNIVNAGLTTLAMGASVGLLKLSLGVQGLVAMLGVGTLGVALWSWTVVRRDPDLGSRPPRDEAAAPTHEREVQGGASGSVAG